MTTPAPAPAPPPAPARRRLLLPATGLPPPPGLGSVMQTVQGQAMGTTWQVRAAVPRELPGTLLQAQVEQVIARIVQQMSAFRADSDLCRFAALPAGQWQPLPPDFARVMRCALQVAQASGGAYDPSAAPLVDAWGFGAARRWHDDAYTPPDATTLAGLRLGWPALRLDTHDRLLQPGGYRLNLNATAKGHAVDAVAQRLAELGLGVHLVEIGGELRGAGLKHDLQPWWVDLEPPDAHCPLAPVRVALSGLAVATSGNYRRHYRHAGRSRPHTIDPRTREPVTHGLASVTVLHDHCLWADAWSTALMVLGPAEGLSLAEREGLMALLQWHDKRGRWQEAMSSALRAALA